MKSQYHRPISCSCGMETKHWRNLDNHLMDKASEPFEKHHAINEASQ